MKQTTACAIAAAIGWASLLTACGDAPNSSGGSDDALSSELISNAVPGSSSAALSSQAANRVCNYTVTNIGWAGSGTLACAEKTYSTVTMGTQVWMAENLDFGAQVAGVANQADATYDYAEKYCFNDSAAHCAAYGGLYQWHTLMALPSSCDTTTTTTTSALPCRIDAVHRGICPLGWHVPTKGEWDALDSWTDANNGGATNDAGISLKSTNLWYEDAGTDAFGWGGLPGGDRFDEYFFVRGDMGYWWSASEDSTTAASSRILSGFFENLLELSSDKTSCGFSVRCVKD